MASILNKKIVHHLAELARIELNDREEERLLRDLQKILGYFTELQKLDTSGVVPMTGGTTEKNVFREDMLKKRGKSRNSATTFPEKENGFLKIPPIFSVEGGSLPKEGGAQTHASGRE